MSKERPRLLLRAGSDDERDSAGLAQAAALSAAAEQVALGREALEHAAAWDDCARALCVAGDAGFCGQFLGFWGSRRGCSTRLSVRLASKKNMPKDTASHACACMPLKKVVKRPRKRVEEDGAGAL